MLKFHVIDVNMYGSALLLEDGSTHILIDLAFETGTDKLELYLKKLGITHIDLLVITHPHRDHMAGQGAGGLQRFKDFLTIDEIWSNGVPLPVWFDGVTVSPYGLDNIDDYDAYLNIIYPSGYNVANTASDHPTIQGIGTPTITYIEPRAGYNKTFGQISLKVLNPQTPHLQSDTNSSSIVIQVTYQGRKIMLSGDSNMASETDILNIYSPSELKSDILYLGHHGINDSTGANWYNTVNPEYVTVQRRDHLLSQRIRDLINSNQGNLYDIYGNEDFYYPDYSNFKTYVFNVDIGGITVDTVLNTGKYVKRSRLFVKNNGIMKQAYILVKDEGEYKRCSEYLR